MQKFFTPPLLLFYTFFFWVWIWNVLYFQNRFSMSFLRKKRGKKLVRVVKNFCISKYEYSAFFCTKNHYHILKTRENRYKWKRLSKRFWVLNKRTKLCQKNYACSKFKILLTTSSTILRYEWKFLNEFIIYER